MTGILAKVIVNYDFWDEISRSNTTPVGFLLFLNHSKLSHVVPPGEMGSKQEVMFAFCSGQRGCTLIMSVVLIGSFFCMFTRVSAIEDLLFLPHKGTTTS
jgi:hypothetical protein